MPALLSCQLYSTFELGVQIAQDVDIFNTLLPELVSKNNAKLFTFGEGLAKGCSDKNVFWQNVYEQLAKHPSKIDTIMF
jgi:hypothetical protein